MKKLFVSLLLFNISFSSFCQESDYRLENIIEEIAENTDEEIDYAELYEDLYYFSEHPINMNETNKEELSKLNILNSFQISKLLNHIEKNGKLISHLELQSITGFDLQTIRYLLPFISINTFVTKKQVLANINQYILIRDQFYLQSQKGYIPDENGETYYLGNSHRTYLKYRLKNKFIQAGITAEKDAGENFLGNNQPYGFDFYSAHLQIKDIGFIKNIIIGDYQINFGQGLVMQSGLSFGKSSEVINIQKSGNLIRAHTSSAENLFFRGGAIQFIPKENLDIIVFASSHKVDANITDTLENNELLFSSIQGSGMHRTINELADKNIILQNHIGTHANYNYKDLNIGASYYYTKINGEYNKSVSVSNQFDFNQNTNHNIGIDYQYLYKNMNIVGEIGRSESGSIAHINGIMLGLDKTISASLLYRDYNRNYQSEYANGFAERNTQNERGVYLGLEFTPSHKFKIKTYADHYDFPWLRYGINAPTKGNDYLLQVEYKINRKTRIYTRYKREQQENQMVLSTGITNKTKENIRFHINYLDGENWFFANRIESTHVDFENQKEYGFMLYQDIKYKPLFSRLSFTCRYILFNTPTYESRIYAYENDVLYGYSIPAYYGKGQKIYLVTKYNIQRNTDIWLRISHIKYSDRNVLKSGYDEISDNKMTEIKIQVRYKF